jgi:cytidylate kinase
MTTLVTLSASYGSGGTRVGQALAEELQVPFVDRLIPLGVAENLDVTVDEAVAHDQKVVSSWLQRLLRGFANADPGVPAPLVGDDFSSDAFLRATEEVITSHAATGAGVIVGRAGAVVLQQDPRVLRVRLDGPIDRRVDQAVRLEGVDEATARTALPKADRAHLAYLRHFYNVDVRDPRLYHLVIDSTAIPIEACVELLAVAARSVGATRT